MFLLDTNVLSELRKIRAGKADPNVARWADEVEADSLYLSAMTIMELEIGILRVERKDPSRGMLLRNWLDERVLPEFEGRIFPVDVPVALQCARLHVPDPRSERDTLIAATGLAHGMMVVTRNVGDFQHTNVPLLNPWESTGVTR